MMNDFITYILIASTFFYLGVEFGKIIKPKLNPDNTIIIHPVEEKIIPSEDDIKKLLVKNEIINGLVDGKNERAEMAVYKLSNVIQIICKQWIEENL